MSGKRLVAAEATESDVAEATLRPQTLDDFPGEEQLRALAARVPSQALDRAKPLWEMWLVQGLEEAGPRHGAGDARRNMRWLAGSSDEIPVDCDNRGRLIGARGDYARGDDEIRQVRDSAQRGLDAFDFPEPMDPADARNPWRWDPAWMNAAWLQGVRDLLIWVPGEHHVSPRRNQFVAWPPLDYLASGEEAAEEIARQGRPGCGPADPGNHPPQYGEAIQATIRWLRGEVTVPPVDRQGCGPYAA